MFLSYLLTCRNPLNVVNLYDNSRRCILCPVVCHFVPCSSHHHCCFLLKYDMMTASLNLSLTSQVSGSGSEWMGRLGGIDRRRVLLLHLPIAQFFFLRAPNVKWPSEKELKKQMVSARPASAGHTKIISGRVSEMRNISLNPVTLRGKMIKGKYSSFA